MPLVTNTLDFHTKPPKWVGGRWVQVLLVLSICVMPIQDLNTQQRSEWVLEVMYGRHKEVSWEDSVLDTWQLVHALKVLLLGFCWKDSQTWDNQITHTKHTNSQYLHFKILFCEMAWEKLAFRFPVGLGLSHYFLVYLIPVGLSA